MKKLLPTLLALLLFCLALPCASAADVTPSPQKLSVDGTDADCDKYNIDGSNYFKLRDLAYLLSKSDSRFSVAKERRRIAERAVRAKHRRHFGTLIAQ